MHQYDRKDTDRFEILIFISSFYYWLDCCEYESALKWMVISGYLLEFLPFGY